MRDLDHVVITELLNNYNTILILQLNNLHESNIMKEIINELLKRVKHVLYMYRLAFSYLLFMFGLCHYNKAT